MISVLFYHSVNFLNEGFRRVSGTDGPTGVWIALLHKVPRPDAISHTSHPDTRSASCVWHPLRNHLSLPFCPEGCWWCQSLQCFVAVNKGNRNHKAAGASQLPRCLDLIKHNRNFFGNVFAGVLYDLLKLQHLEFEFVCAGLQWKSLIFHFPITREIKVQIHKKSNVSEAGKKKSCLYFITQTVSLSVRGHY